MFLCVSENVHNMLIVCWYTCAQLGLEIHSLICFCFYTLIHTIFICILVYNFSVIGSCLCVIVLEKKSFLLKNMYVDGI